MERANPVAVRVWRGDVVESVHRAVVVAARPDGSVVASLGDSGLVSYLRSAAKPLQAVPLVSSGAADAFGLDDEEIAVVAGSHNGQEAHVAVVERLLAKIGLGQDALRCGRHPPFHGPTARSLGDAYGPLHHNCSGKHAGMLAVCVHRGWDVASYLAPDHPVQQEILGVVARAVGLEPAALRLGVDGCGVPSFAAPVHAAARAFATLADPESMGAPWASAVARVVRAMAAHPEMVAGEDRLDTRLMRAAPGRLVVKAGAEAFYGATLLQERLGVALKVEDGASRAVAPLLVRSLVRLGRFRAEERAAIEAVHDPVIKNHAGRSVGRLEPTDAF